MAFTSDVLLEDVFLMIEVGFVQSCGAEEGAQGVRSPLKSVN